jgi:hypothetical protein
LTTGRWGFEYGYDGVKITSNVGDDDSANQFLKFSSFPMTVTRSMAFAFSSDQSNTGTGFKMCTHTSVVPVIPTAWPTEFPTDSPPTFYPTEFPTDAPTFARGAITPAPTASPTQNPTPAAQPAQFSQLDIAFLRALNGESDAAMNILKETCAIGQSSPNSSAAYGIGAVACQLGHNLNSSFGINGLSSNTIGNVPWTQLQREATTNAGLIKQYQQLQTNQEMTTKLETGVKAIKASVRTSVASAEQGIFHFVNEGFKTQGAAMQAGFKHVSDEVETNTNALKQNAKLLRKTQAAVTTNRNMLTKVTNQLKASKASTTALAKQVKSLSQAEQVDHQQLASSIELLSTQISSMNGAIMSTLASKPSMRGGSSGRGGIDSGGDDDAAWGKVGEAGNCGAAASTLHGAYSDGQSTYSDLTGGNDGSLYGLANQVYNTANGAYSTYTGLADGAESLYKCVAPESSGSSSGGDEGGEYDEYEGSDDAWDVAEDVGSDFAEVAEDVEEAGSFFEEVGGVLETACEILCWFLRRKLSTGTPVSHPAVDAANVAFADLKLLTQKVNHTRAAYVYGLVTHSAPPLMADLSVHLEKGEQYMQAFKDDLRASFGQNTTQSEISAFATNVNVSLQAHNIWHHSTKTAQTSSSRRAVEVLQQMQVACSSALLPSEQITTSLCSQASLANAAPTAITGKLHTLLYTTLGHLSQAVKLYKYLTQTPSRYANGFGLTLFSTDSGATVLAADIQEQLVTLMSNMQAEFDSAAQTRDAAGGKSEWSYVTFNNYEHMSDFAQFVNSIKNGGIPTFNFLMPAPLESAFYGAQVTNMRAYLLPAPSSLNSVSLSVTKLGIEQSFDASGKLNTFVRHSWKSSNIHSDSALVTNKDRSWGIDYSIQGDHCTPGSKPAFQLSTSDAVTSTSLPTTPYGMWQLKVQSGHYRSIPALQTIKQVRIEFELAYFENFDISVKPMFGADNSCPRQAPSGLTKFCPVNCHEVGTTACPQSTYSTGGLCTAPLKDYCPLCGMTSASSAIVAPPRVPAPNPAPAAPSSSAGATVGALVGVVAAVGAGFMYKKRQTAMQAGSSMDSGAYFEMQ